MADYNFLNDITKFGSNALSAANTLQRQVRAWVTEQVEYLIKSMELITQEDFSAHIDAQNGKFSALENRIAELEKLLAVSAKPKAAAPKAEVTKKVVVKKNTTKKAAAEKTH